MPRFVVLEHIGTADYKPGRHWDLMLEAGESLRTWELDNVPSAAGPVHALALSDHRLAYLEFEGPLSNNRGTVSRWDCGEYEIVSQDPFELAVLLDGRQLQGQLQLTRESTDSPAWLMIFEPRVAGA